MPTKTKKKPTQIHTAEPKPAPAVTPDSPRATVPAQRAEPNQKYAKTVEENVSHMRFNLMACVPGLLDTDKRFRRLIISYLANHYRRELPVKGVQHAK